MAEGAGDGGEEGTERGGRRGEGGAPLRIGGGGPSAESVPKLRVTQREGGRWVAGAGHDAGGGGFEQVGRGELGA